MLDFVHINPSALGITRKRL